jgi:type VI secretion system protein ImpJ
MMRAHELPASIQWHEGLLLSPQHFQQLCLRQERLLHYRLGQAAPLYWGVSQLRTDQALLFEGTLRVLELEAILPDGLVVSHGQGQVPETDLQVDLRPHLEAAKQGPVLVHLAVPVERPGEKAEGDMGRYSSFSGDPIADETTGARPLRIPRLRPRLRLLAGNDPPPARFCVLPILAVRYKNGAFLAAEYIPPLVRVAPDSPLGELYGQVCRKIREKAMYLVELIRAPAITTKPEVVEENKRLISYLVAQLPTLEALLRAGAAHPMILHAALCAVAGSVAAIGNQLIPPVFPAYDHNNIRRSFSAVADFISQTIDEGISEAFTAIPFRWDNGLFTLNFEREWADRVLIIGAKAPPGMADQQLQDWMNTSLIGTSGKYRMLRDRRLLGANRQPVDRYEGLVATRGTLLFQLKVDPEYIVPNEALLVGNAGAGGVRPAEMFLYVANKG